MFTHLTEKKQPQMVDVGGKAPSARFAHARTIVCMPASVIVALESSGGQAPKGPVFQTAILAGVMGAKRCADLIPLCHPLALNHCSVDVAVQSETEIVVDCRVRVDGKTGVEMEALTGASIAALTLYDMCKALTQDIVIRETRLIEKSGGKKDLKPNTAASTDAAQGV